MKKISLLILTFVTVGVFAQNSKVTSAGTYLRSYQQYGFDVNDLLKAQEAIDVAVEHEATKNSAKAYLTKGRVYAAIASEKAIEEKNGALRTAKEAFLKVIALEKASEKKARYTSDAIDAMSKISNLFYANGFDAYNAGDYANAYIDFNNVVNINTITRDANDDIAIDTSAIYATANSASKIKKFDEAVNLYNRLIELNYNNPSIFIGLAGVYKEQGNTEKANETINAGLKQFPSDKALNIEKVNILLSSGDQEAAIASMKEAISIDPKNENLYFALAVAYDTQKDYENAIVNYKKAIDLREGYFDAYYNLGAVYYNQAAEKTTEMNELPLDDQANYDRLSGEIDGLFKEALPYLTKAHSLNETDLGSIIALKEIYARTQQFDKSKEMKIKYEEVSKNKGIE